MASAAPLTGSELIDCAKANSTKGAEVAASRCGYDDIPTFETALKKAGEHIGVTINSFADLVRSSSDRQSTGAEIAPESLTDL